MVFASVGASHQPRSWWQRPGWERESDSPSMGSVRGLHSEVRLSQRDLITLFRLVENFRTSDIPYSNARTKTSSKINMRWLVPLCPP